MRLHSLAQHFVHLLDAKVQVMVPNAGHIYSTPIERRYHLFALKHGADERRAEQVAREDRQAVDALVSRLLLIVPHRGDEARRSALVLFLGLLLNVVAVVEVEDAELLLLWGRALRHA